MEQIDLFFQGDRIWPPNWRMYENGKRFSQALSHGFKVVDH
jgi:hypothetical protein